MGLWIMGCVNLRAQLKARLPWALEADPGPACGFARLTVPPCSVRPGPASLTLGGPRSSLAVAESTGRLLWEL